MKRHLSREHLPCVLCYRPGRAARPLKPAPEQHGNTRGNVAEMLVSPAPGMGDHFLSLLDAQGFLAFYKAQYS